MTLEEYLEEILVDSRPDPQHDVCCAASVDGEPFLVKVVGAVLIRPWQARIDVLGVGIEWATTTIQLLDGSWRQLPELEQSRYWASGRIDRLEMRAWELAVME